jgi:hypothetical protein
MKRFWQWYEKHETLNLGIAAGLFSLQIVHLFWLSAHVIALRIFGVSFFDPHGPLEFIIVLIDYTEIPALIATSLVYINRLRKKYDHKSLLYLIFLNSQWLHIFWITDEFVETMLTGTGSGSVLPAWLAWVAILIDYLELPVIYDTVKSFIASLKMNDLKEALKTLKEDS